MCPDQAENLLSQSVCRGPPDGRQKPTRLWWFEYAWPSQMRVSIVGSQLLMGINKLKIALNWKSTVLFCQNQSNLKDCDLPCNSLRSSSTGLVYMIRFYAPPKKSFFDECTLKFYCFLEAWFKQGFASSAELVRQWSVKFNSLLCPYPSGNHEYRL